MDTATREAVALLKELVATPSVSRDESAAAAKIAAFIGSKGYAAQRCGNNVYALSRGYSSEKPTLLLDAHIDTVRPAAGWKHDPFSPTEDGGRLYGLGTNDDGASLVSLLAAFLAVDGHALPYNIIMSASAEEEVSGKGGIEMVLPHFPHIDAGLIAEPTGLRAAVAEKGLMVIDFTAHGRAGHAARGEGVNAVYKALDDVAALRALCLDRVSPTLGRATVNVTIINAGTQHNVIPAECTFTADVRSNELYSNQELFSIIASAVGSDAKARSFRLNSSGIQPTHPLARRASVMGCEAFGSPTLSNQALLPFPTIKIGPGESSRSHTADEYVEIREIAEGVAFFTEYLKGLEL